MQKVMLQNSGQGGDTTKLDLKSAMVGAVVKIPASQQGDFLLGEIIVEEIMAYFSDSRVSGVTLDVSEARYIAGGICRRAHSYEQT